MAKPEAYRALFQEIGKKLELSIGQQTQLLQFLSDIEGWAAVDETRLLPAGGLTDDMLVKVSDADYDVDWYSPEYWVL